MIDIVIRNDKVPMYVMGTNMDSAAELWTWIYEMLISKEAYE